MTNLHVHTEYSLLRSTIRIPDLVRRAKETGHTAVCLTDTNAMYGAVRLWQEARKAGLKPVIGCQIEEKNASRGPTDASGVSTGSPTAGPPTAGPPTAGPPTAGPPTAGPSADSNYCLLLAKNNDGYAEMNRLLTLRNTGGGGFDLAGEIATTVRNCFVLTPSTGIAGLLKGKIGGLFLEAPLTWPGRSVDDLVAFASSAGIGVIPTWPAYFLEPHDFEVFKLLSAIRQNRLIYSVESWAEAYRGNHFIGAASFAARLEGFPGSAELIRGITDSCDVGFRFDHIELPSIPGGRRSGPRRGFRRLVSLCWRGLAARDRAGSPPYRERLRKELSVVRLLGLSDYFLIVLSIVRFARQRKIFYTGRGSAANSLVCYCLRITFVDPVRYNLYFERFLHAERKGLPDIDLDFPWNERDTVIRHIYGTYTAERTALISTHISFHARSAIRETARVFGLSRADIGVVTKRLPWFFSVSRLADLAPALPEFRDLDLDAPGLGHWKKILVYAGKITGLCRHVSIHPGGMVIAARPLSAFTALERAPKGYLVTQLDMYDIEKMGLMKMDILGQRSLAVVTDAARMIAPEKMADLERIAEDGPTLDLVRGGRSIGCFYIESPAMRQLLRKLDVRTFEELTAASSVIRPGVAESGMMQKYVAFHNDPSSVTYLHPDFAVLLRETYGIMIYQEDVIRVALEVGGLSPAEADILRKSMSGKGRSRGAIERMEPKFVAGCVGRGYLEETGRELWRQVESFAGYAFCKAHSASFARLSLMVAWLKAHFPAEFFSAVLSNRGGFYHPLVYVEEARRLGVPILPPSVNRAQADCAPDRPLPREGDPLAKGLRAGLAFIKGLRASTVRRIIAGRAATEYLSVPDLVRRCGLSATEVTALNAAGGLDGLGWNRRQTLLYAAKFLDPCRTGAPRTDGLWQTRPSPDTGDPGMPDLPDLSPAEKLLEEIGAFGFCVTANPLSLVTPDRRIVASGMMKEHAGKTVTMLGIRISSKRVPGKDGNVMEFISFLDLEGWFEAFLPSRAHARLAPLLHRSSAFYVTGRVRDDFGALTLDIHGMEPVRLRACAPALENAV